MFISIAFVSENYSLKYWKRFPHKVHEFYIPSHSSQKGSGLQRSVFYHHESDSLLLGFSSSLLGSLSLVSSHDLLNTVQSKNTDKIDIIEILVDNNGCLIGGRGIRHRKCCGNEGNIWACLGNKSSGGGEEGCEKDGRKLHLGVIVKVKVVS